MRITLHGGMNMIDLYMTVRHRAEHNHIGRVVGISPAMVLVLWNHIPNHRGSWVNRDMLEVCYD